MHATTSEMPSDRIVDKIAALPEDSTYFSLEFFPPKTQQGFANLHARLSRMAHSLRPLFVNVTWGAGGSTSTKSLALADMTQRQLGLTTCLHLTCTNMSRKLIDGALEQAKALGIRNILALRGDPPRSDEYRSNELENEEEDDSNKEFTWAVDLVRYIRKEYGQYFCIGVAAYPEGHSDQSHPEHQHATYDLPFLVEKVEAGADFLMTQLFYDVHAYQDYEKLLRQHESGAFKTIPIIPGLMPIQSYQILKRTTKLSHANLPSELSNRLEPIKNDDEAVKRAGVDILSEMVETLKKNSYSGPKGFHFYTLNLEKAVAHIVERCKLIGAVNNVAVEDDDTPVANGNGDKKAKARRRSSIANSAPQNRVVIDKTSRSASSGSATFEAFDDEAGVPGEDPPSRKDALAISEGEGALGREATWDDFPNGRWGDARSPAYGEIDGYGVSLHVSIPSALKLWGYPVDTKDITSIFARHVRGELDAIPWSEEGLNPETETIREELAGLISKGWWTVASQPGVNGFRSDHEIFGWGPPSGFVFQKPFVEFFCSHEDWTRLRTKLDKDDQVTYFACNGKGDFQAADEESLNPVTWGCFTGKEIVTPTMIEAVSFRAWAEEAFGIWTEWRHVYPPRSPSAKLLREIRDNYWLVNIIHHDFTENNGLWKMLLEA
ncbi:methylenetetrahydrofolate reductase-like protein [Aureobasidium pullulans]|nr:methylenetetrahydrofolate reductase-like protein [Aureobasidium pullulans]